MAQHAYYNGRSVETAIHEMVGTIEESLYHKKYTLEAFLDIEGALHNLKASFIRNVPMEFELEGHLGQWIS